MKSKAGLLVLILLIAFSGLQAQINIVSTNPIAERILMGNYNPASYQAGTIITRPDSISQGILKRVSSDSLHAYLDVLRSFQNRNTGADTVSGSKGIGAARRWAYSKFAQFSTRNDNRLIPSYLQFDLSICNQGQHRNIYAVLPGTDTSDKSIVIIEAHIDSRCADLCDTACLAEGMEDNGSGTAMVLELARVMSAYTYKRSIVFLLVIGEEQGLYGGNAFATYATQKQLSIRSVLNNDVIGGIICGQTSSAPSCPGLNNIDSTNVRLFSFGGYSSLHKGLARFIKLEYKEMIRPFASVPMTIQIMTPEDRTGRSGDHIPFRQQGFTAVRLTSANENGDANVTSPSYTVRQHTSRDILGVDLNADTILDSFFVDFHYLARNSVINGNALAMSAIGPKTPDFTATATGPTELSVQIISGTAYPAYRVGVRSITYDWDSVYTINSTSAKLNLPLGNYILSVASVDSSGVESLFSLEKTAAVAVKGMSAENSPLELLQNKPNPFDEMTMISVVVLQLPSFKDAYIQITEAGSGKELQRLPIQLKQGINEVAYHHGYHPSHSLVYTLVVDGKKLQSKQMVFAN